VAVVRGFAPLVEAARRKAVRYFRKTFSRKSNGNIFQSGQARLKNQYNFGAERGSGCTRLCAACRGCKTKKPSAKPRKCFLKVIGFE
jgi:hypothetical protein